MLLDLLVPAARARRLLLRRGVPSDRAAGVFVDPKMTIDTTTPPTRTPQKSRHRREDEKTRQAHAAPEVGERVLCRHPFDSSKRAYVTPSRVLELHAPVFEGGRRVAASEDLRELRAYCQRQLGEVREDVLRPLNPTPYKTSVSAELFSFLQDALQRHQPITELT